MCSPNLEALFINCKPFYSPREFSSFILVNVYVPPDACVSATMQQLAEQISEMEQMYPDSLLIILGDFNKANLSRELPKYRQHVTCPTRDSNILDHCYTIIKDAYHSVPRAALGLSDHCLVNIIPTYRQNLKSSKPVLRTVKRWTNEAEQDLKACFYLTDGSVIEAAATDLDELTETVTSYISFCEDICIPTRTFLSFNNDKPWFTGKLKQLCQAKEDAYRSGDKILYNQARNRLTRRSEWLKRTTLRSWKKNFQQKKIQRQYGLVWGTSPCTRHHPHSLWRINNWLMNNQTTKLRYRERIASHFQLNDSRHMWQGLRTICAFGNKSSAEVRADPLLADELNTVYSHFECNGGSATLPISTSGSRRQSSDNHVITVLEDEVRRALKRVNVRKAAGPDGITGRVLRSCADQLAGLFTSIFNESLATSVVPTSFKKSFIIPVPKNNKLSCLNDYRPVALTSIVMKVFERLVKSHICSSIPVTLDPLQFAYRPNRSTDDAISHILHSSLTHIDSSNGNYVRLLFIDYSSAFNTKVSIKLASKLTDLGLNSSLCDWIQDFLTGRPLVVKVGQFISNSITLNVGAPQGCILSPLLYSLYTHDCVSSHSSTSIIKFADDTVVLGLISNNDETTYLDEVERITSWCQDNCLSLNVSKTKELIVDFRRDTCGPTLLLWSVGPLWRGCAASSTSV